MINNIYKEVEKIKDDPNFIDLTDSNFARPEFFEPAYKIIKPAINTLLKNRQYKPDPLGDFSARKSVSNYYAGRKIAISPNEIIITASTSEAYNIIIQTFSKPRDSALIPNPSYPLFDYLFKLNKVSTDFYYLEFDNNWKINLEKLSKSIKKNTRFLVLINPNNPTGSVIQQANLDAIIQLCQNNNIMLIIDEVFISYTKYKYLLPLKKDTSVPIFILNGISKMFGLPDFKLGWISIYCSNPEIYTDMLETTNDTYLSTNNISQGLLPELFDNIKEIQKPIVHRINSNRKIINKFFTDNADLFFYEEVEGGIHVFVIIKKKYNKWKDEEDFTINLLKNAKLLVYPGYFFDYPQTNQISFSFSYLTDTKLLVNALDKLQSFLA